LVRFVYMMKSACLSCMLLSKFFGYLWVSPCLVSRMLHDTPGKKSIVVAQLGVAGGASTGRFGHVLARHCAIATSMRRVS
jgi:hypothetical protein